MLVLQLVPRMFVLHHLHLAVQLQHTGKVFVCLHVLTQLVGKTHGLQVRFDLLAGRRLVLALLS